eukprot:Sspe_Gene.49199::Locus_26261_Transcript_1_1_Confidence_1.000_Length_1202::g.49199::m.49199
MGTLLPLLLAMCMPLVALGQACTAHSDFDDCWGAGCMWGSRLSCVSCLAEKGAKSSWLEFYGKQFKLFTTALLWSDALEACRTEGGTLAVPASELELSILQEMLTTVPAWVGVAQRSALGAPANRLPGICAIPQSGCDGTSCASCPDFPLSDQLKDKLQDYGVVGSSMVSLKPDWRRPYFCEKPAEPWSVYGSYEYRTFAEPDDRLSQTCAARWCRNAGGTLATLRDPITPFASANDTWIGLQRLASSGSFDNVWTWLDGTGFPSPFSTYYKADWGPSGAFPQDMTLVRGATYLDSNQYLPTLRTNLRGFTCQRPHQTVRPTQ